jgi:hypothetical protein
VAGIRLGKTADMGSANSRFWRCSTEGYDFGLVFSPAQFARVLEHKALACGVGELIRADPGAGAGNSFRHWGCDYAQCSVAILVDRYGSKYATGSNRWANSQFHESHNGFYFRGNWDDADKESTFYFDGLESEYCADPTKSAPLDDIPEAAIFTMDSKGGKLVIHDWNIADANMQNGVILRGPATLQLHNVNGGRPQAMLVRCDDPGASVEFYGAFNGFGDVDNVVRYPDTYSTDSGDWYQNAKLFGYAIASPQLGFRNDLNPKANVNWSSTGLVLGPIFSTWQMPSDSPTMFSCILENTTDSAITFTPDVTGDPSKPGFAARARTIPPREKRRWIYLNQLTGSPYFLLDNPSVRVSAIQAIWGPRTLYTFGVISECLNKGIVGV